MAKIWSCEAISRGVLCCESWWNISISISYSHATNKHKKCFHINWYETLILFLILVPYVRVGKIYHSTKMWHGNTSFSSPFLKESI